MTGYRISLTASMVLALSGLSVPSDASEKCRIIPFAQMPVTMMGLRPLVTARINGKNAQFLLDSGAFFNMMSVATANEFDLKLKPFGMRVLGIGGSTVTSVAAVEDFQLMGIDFHHAEFLVGGSEVGAAGVLGQNLLSRFDVEYDLAKGAIRLFRTEECENKKDFLAYWVSPGQAFSSMDINKIDRKDAHTIGVAYVNGKAIRAMFDTGAATSALSLKAAERAGIQIDSPRVVSAGYARGFGPGMAKQYVGVFENFRIGDGEEIKNTRLRIVDFELPDADMLIGADFFLSHHVYVSNSQRKLYLTYNGGAVFNLVANTAAAPGDSTLQADEQTPSIPAEAPADAAEYARRGAAFAARHDFGHGLADLSKAIEIDPNESEYFYRRAIVYRQNGQRNPALADFDSALRLNADYLEAYVERADLRLSQNSITEAIADLDAADRLAAPQADLRLRLAGLYGSADAFTSAIGQFDRWIDNHPQDSRFAWALVTRCLMRALQNQDLTAGLDDCNRVSRLVNIRNPDSANVFVNRGMVRLRQGEYAKALGDFDDALKLQPKNVLALYGRGVAKSRKDRNDAGGSDIEAAEKLAPALVAKYQAYGFAP